MASHSATAAPAAAQLLALARILVSTTCAPVHAEAEALLKSKLVRSGLFHGNPAEAAVWVRSANNPASVPCPSRVRADWPSRRQVFERSSRIER